MLNRITAMLLGLGAAMGIVKPRDAEPLPEEISPVDVSGAARAYVSRSAFPRRRVHYVLPRLPFGESYQTPNRIGRSPLTDTILEFAAREKRKRRGASRLALGTTRTILGESRIGFVHAPGLKTASDTRSDVLARQRRRAAQRANGLRAAS